MEDSGSGNDVTGAAIQIDTTEPLNTDRDDKIQLAIPFESKDKSYPLTDGKLDKELDALKNRYSDWLQANGWERASNLNDTVREIINRYAFFRGETDLTDSFKFSIDIYASVWRLDRAIDYKSSAYQLIKPAGFIPISIFGLDRGMSINSSYSESGHNVGSMHYVGRAVDFSVRTRSREQMNTFGINAINVGLRLLDERTKPVNAKVWTGPHFHIDDNTKPTKSNITRTLPRIQTPEKTALRVETSLPTVNRAKDGPIYRNKQIL